MHEREREADLSGGEVTGGEHRDRRQVHAPGPHQTSGVRALVHRGVVGYARRRRLAPRRQNGRDHVLFASMREACRLRGLLAAWYTRGTEDRSWMLPPRGCSSSRTSSPTRFSCGEACAARTATASASTSGTP